MYIYSFALEVIIITWMRISKLLGKTWPWGMTMSSGKSTDGTRKTHLGYLAAQLRWLVDLASLVRNMNWWLSCRVPTLQSVVAGSISSGGDYGIFCWWDLIRSKQQSSVPVCRALLFGEFSDYGNSIHKVCISFYIYLIAWILICYYWFHAVFILQLSIFRPDDCRINTTWNQWLQNSIHAINYI